MNDALKSILPQTTSKTTRRPWLAGAAAAVSLVNVTDATASDITVNLTGNYASAAGGNHLNPDLAGGATADVNIFTVGSFLEHLSGVSAFNHAKDRKQSQVFVGGIDGYGVLVNAEIVSTVKHHKKTIVNYVVEETGPANTPHTSPGTYNYSIPIVFNDPLINGGITTPATLEVTASDVFGNVGIQLDSFTYAPASPTAPDQTSTLALLALGAGGVLALRERRRVG